MFRIGTQVYVTKLFVVDRLIRENLKNNTPNRIIEPFIITNRKNHDYDVAQDFGGNDINAVSQIFDGDITTDRDEFIQYVKYRYEILENNKRWQTEINNQTH